MDYMLCRNRVRDFERWKRVFDRQADAHRAAGLRLLHLWRCADHPNQVYFLFEVDDVARARTFVTADDATEAAREAGLIEGEIHFFRGSLGYSSPVAAVEGRAVAGASE
jgi:hypothetical protein